MMLSGWPDAISCETTVPTLAVYYLSEYLGGTTDVAYFNIGYGEALTFDEATRVLQNVPEFCTAGEVSIDDTGVFTQYDFGSSGSTSSVATTTQTIHNPTLDMWLGFVMFFAVFWFIVWFFRRPYDTY